MSIPAYENGIPAISGWEQEVDEAILQSRSKTVFADDTSVDFSKIKSAAAIALHMHQPLIPGGGDNLQTAALISNLQHMFEHPDVGDNHNASVFRWCYKRMGEFLPELFSQGKEPRGMLEYSGTLLHGLHQMEAHDVLDALRTITQDHNYRKGIEWLGCPWGHPVAPSTPIQDFRLHVKAFQQFFAALFGIEALTRIKGFSPSEMALPNHPDVAYEFVKTLKDCGYKWVIVQEHTIERPENGHGPQNPHIPHRLVCRNSKGETISITAIIKTQGSDTKLVAQMQPWYEACGLSRCQIGDKTVPPLVTQIADGENGGVMMNEFPDKYKEVVHQASHSETPLLNATEYLELLEKHGVTDKDFPEVQPIKQKAIWDRFDPKDRAEKLSELIETLKKEDHQFHMDGGSWTNNISWVQGYENVLEPMDKASSLFSQKALDPKINPKEERFRNALFHLMCSQTSCYRYWGQGIWTDYGKELCRRTESILNADF